MVAKILERAFNEASKLSEEEQEQLAAWILAELKSENGWSRAFSESQSGLVKLANEAFEDEAEGRTEDLDTADL